MIILRKLNKLFGIRDEQGNDPLPNPLFLPDPEIERQYGEIELQVENTKKNMIWGRINWIRPLRRL